MLPAGSEMERRAGTHDNREELKVQVVLDGKPGQNWWSWNPPGREVD